MNPKCITNFEKVTTRFRVVSQKPVALKCHYCEKITDQERMEII
jgi:aspartate carbamoyltransferase regulatory subunit